MLCAWLSKAKKEKYSKWSEGMAVPVGAVSLCAGVRS